MRLHAPALLLVSILAAAGLVTATAANAVAGPSVAPVVVAGNGPFDLYRLTGTGFPAGADVALSFENGGTTRAITTLTATPQGIVTQHTGARIPLSATSGSARYLLTQVDGTVTPSPTFTIEAPAVSVPPIVQSDAPTFHIGLTGLANTMDVVREISVDGRTVSGLSWFSDDRSFSDSGVTFRVPRLAVGPHELTFRQSGRPEYAFESTVTVNVPSPVLSVRQHVGTSDDIAFDVANSGYYDGFDITVTGAAGDRHVVAGTITNPSSALRSVRVEGMSRGLATMTAVSLATGGTTSATFTVEPSAVTSPTGLSSGQWLVDPQGRGNLVMQTDGNLVMYDDGLGRSAVWSTKTSGHPGAHLSVQSDGNLVVYDVGGRALWNSGTVGIGAGARFEVVGPDVLLSTASGRRVWSTFNQLTQDSLSISANQYLYRGQGLGRALDRIAGAVRMQVQPDGNVVVGADYGGVLWSTGTAGHPNAYLVLQADGNLVLHAVNGAVLWANYAKASGARLQVQGDGNIVEYASNGKAVWSTRTVVK